MRVVFAAGIMIAAILLLIWVKYYIERMIDKRISAYQNDLLEKHCEEVENMYRQTRGWRHDYHNHIQTMKAHLAMGELDRLSAYLNELDADLTMVDTVIKTGNVMIDAVLNSKLSLAKARGIRVEAKALVPKELPISEVELCLIVGNLLDNAMEACMRILEEEKRFIRVYIDILKGQLYIYVMNSVQGTPKRHGKIYLSTKNTRESGGHGFGLMRIDSAVERCHGYLERQAEEDVFVTEVLLPL